VRASDGCADGGAAGLAKAIGSSANKINTVYDYRHQQRNQERALEAYRLAGQAGRGGAGAAAASAAAAAEEQEEAGEPPLQPGSAVPSPQPMASGALAAAALRRRGSALLPAGLNGDGAGGGGGALQLGAPPPPPPRWQQLPVFVGGIVNAAARRLPSRLQPPGRAAAGQRVAYVPAGRRRRSNSPEGAIGDGDRPPRRRTAGVSGRPRANNVATITQAELDELLQQPVAAWKAAYAILYNVDSCTSGNLVWLQQRLRDAVRDDGDGDAVVLLD
jgi:hypothetical protein